MRRAQGQEKVRVQSDVRRIDLDRKLEVCGRKQWGIRIGGVYSLKSGHIL